MMRIFDTHAHYDDEKFSEDRDRILEEVHASGVEYILNPGCDIKSTLLAQQIASEHDYVFFAAGIHPEELDEIPDDFLNVLKRIASDAKCRAIGEIGLDYYWDSSRKDLQKEIFTAQLQLAQELALPVIIHDREAHGDCFAIVRDYSGAVYEHSHPGVFHCFSGSAEMAAELLKRGWYLGVDGPVTYKNARKTIEVLELTPIERILVETDSPYLSPVPLRGQRNNSGNLPHIIEKIAEIKKESPEKIAEITFQNACELFRI